MIVWSLGCYPMIFAVLLALTYWASRRLRRGLLAEPMRLDWRRETQMVLRELAGLLRFCRR